MERQGGRVVGLLGVFARAPAPVLAHLRTARLALIPCVFPARACLAPGPPQTPLPPPASPSGPWPVAVPTHACYLSGWGLLKGKNPHRTQPTVASQKRHAQWRSSQVNLDFRHAGRKQKEEPKDSGQSNGEANIPSSLHLCHQPV